MTHKEKSFFSPAMKLADLIESNYTLLNVLSRFGISLGFGEDTIADVCGRYEINASSFLLICNVNTYPGYVPSDELLNSGNPMDIVRYLHNSHSFYLDNEMKILVRSMDRLIEGCDGKLQKVIRRFLSDYRKEVENHFAYEEDTVFPYVSSLWNGKSGDGYSIEQFEKNHSNIDEKLNDLKNIVMKYLPDTCDTVLRNTVLYHLFFLEKDLDRHTVVENNVLIPMVNRMEWYGKGQ